MAVRVWDETRQPRDPGGEGGGQWVESGALSVAGKDPATLETADVVDYVAGRLGGTVLNYTGTERDSISGKRILTSAMIESPSGAIVTLGVELTDYHDRRNRARRVAVLHDFEVVPQRSGVGTQVMEALKGFADDTGHGVAVFQVATVAEPFYARFPWLTGFDEYNPRLSPEWREAHPALTAAFDPSQPRHPAGGPEGGQWLAVGTRVTTVYDSRPTYGTVVEPIFRGEQHKNDVSIEWDNGKRQKHMKGEVRPTRPGEEAQYAPKAVVAPELRLVKGDPGFPPYFPEGVFAPADRVAFWPKLVGNYQGDPLWKALVLKDDPSRSVFWIADPMGQPSHGVMLNAIKAAGEGPFSTEISWADLHDVSGYGREAITTFPQRQDAMSLMLERHAQDIRDAQDIVAAQTSGMAAAAFDESKHRRHPAGSDAGGEFAPTHFGPGDPGFPRNFPDGVFSPTDDVAFWPMEIGANTMGTKRWHPLWKALVDRNDPSKRLFWFTDPMGAPHHEQMVPWTRRSDIMGANTFSDSGLDPTFLSGFGWQNQYLARNGPDHPMAVVTRELTSKNGDAIAEAQRIANEQRGPSMTRDERLGLAAAGFDATKHPRHPAGSDRGGEWAPKVLGFGDKAFAGTWSKDPDDLLYDAFDPQIVDAYLYRGIPHHSDDGLYPGEEGFRVFPEADVSVVKGGVWWKASYYEPTDELKIWVPGFSGGPHHVHVAEAMGWHASDDFSGLRDFENRMDIMGAGSGDGMTAELQWWDDDARLDNLAIARLREEMAKPSIRAQLRAAERHALGLVEDRLAASAADPFQVAWEEGQRQAETHLDGLQAAYEGALLAEGRKIVKAYKQSNLVAAAEQPGGNTPSSQIIDEILFKEAVLAAVRATQLLIVSRVVLSIAEDPKLARLPVYEMLLADVNVVQSQAAFEAVSDSVNRVLLESLTEGWDVPVTAERLNTVLTDFAPWQATRLARTSLISLANGSSLLAAQALGEDAPTFKTWLTAGDELVRPTHVQADRQTVPVDQPFDVDGVPMMFPGDPSAPDALKQNCRCTLVYGSDPHPLLAYSEDWMVPDGELALSAAFDPSKHPRHPGGSDRGGEWANTFTIENYRHGTPEWWALGKVGDDPSKVGARIEMRADPDWKAMMMVSQERGRGDPSKTNEGRAQAAYGLALEAFNAENVLVARKDGQIVGVLGYSIGQERVAGAMYRTVWGGYAGAIKGGGLPLFKGIVKIAAAEDAALAFQSTTASDDLYDRLGVPRRLMPSGNEYLDEYFVSPEQVKMLDADMFALARERRLAADGEPWVEPELVWLTAAGWDESRVERNPSGEHDNVESPSDGGKFKSKGGGGGRWKDSTGEEHLPLGPAPGTVPIGPGQIRLYHYTGKVGDIVSIANTGLRNDAGKGETYGEPSQIWTSTRMPDAQIKDFVEFAVDTDDPRIDIGKFQPGTVDGTYVDGEWVRGEPFTKETWARSLEGRSSDLTFPYGDILPSEILAYHEPWMQHVRYAIENGVSADTLRSLGDVTTTQAADWLDDHPEVVTEPTDPANFTAAALLAGHTPPMETGRMWRSPWDPNKHPRHPAGSDRGGEFAPKLITYDDTVAQAAMRDWVDRLDMDDVYTDESVTFLRERLDGTMQTALPLLQGRLDDAGVPVWVSPQLSMDQIDVLANPESTFFPDFDVALGPESSAPGFSVWTYEDGRVEVEDVLDLGDTDFFPGGPESQLAQNYASLVDAAGRTPGASDTVTLFRGMSPAELEAWKAGEPIPAGKFFTDQPTVNYAQDQAGVFPELQTFEVPRSSVMRTGQNEFQLSRPATLVDGKLAPVSTRIVPPDPGRYPDSEGGHPRGWGLGRDYRIHDDKRPGAVPKPSLRSRVRDRLQVRTSVTAAAFDETKHPRHPGGSEAGGRFRSATQPDLLGSARDEAWTGPPVAPGMLTRHDLMGAAPIGPLDRSDMYWNRVNSPDVAKRADVWGVTVEGYKDQVAHQLQQEAKDPLVIRTPLYGYRGADPALDIVESGRFMSQIESGVSQGAFAPEIRAAQEKLFFGYPIDMAPELRPIYGMVDSIEGHEIAHNYGDVLWVLKDDIRTRTTVTGIDSLSRPVVPGPINNPGWRATVPPGYAANVQIPIHDQFADGFAGNPDYVEAQFHGGVTLKDVDHVDIINVKKGFPARVTDGVSHSAFEGDKHDVDLLSSLLAPHGITVRAYEDSYARDMGYEIEWDTP